MIIEDWNGRPIEAARSRGGVLAVARVRDNLIMDGTWPPAPIVQKLYRSNQARAFALTELEVLERELGYYCDLQSVHSEDAITWSFFGTLSQAPPGTRSDFLHWLTTRLGLGGSDRSCDISLWRRIPHPDTLAPGGPEIDALLVGDRSVVAIEVKWRSGEGRDQGTKRDTGQMQLRREFFERYGRRIYGDRSFVVVGIEWIDTGQGWLQWADLTAWNVHPHIDEYRRYYDWKVALSRPHEKARRVDPA